MCLPVLNSKWVNIPCLVGAPAEADALVPAPTGLGEVSGCFDLKCRNMEDVLLLYANSWIQIKHLTFPDLSKSKCSHTYDLARFCGAASILSPSLSHPLSLSLTPSLSLSIPIYLNLYVSISIYLYLSQSISIYLYLSQSIYLNLSVSISISVSLNLSICIYRCQSIYVSLSIYLYLSVNLSMCLCQSI